MKASLCRKRRLLLSAHKIVSVITLIFFCAGTVFALPAGQQVVNGQASFITQSNNLTITNSPNAIINWQGFSINNNEAVRFIQQYASSSVLNRVIGQDPSRILGLLQSNGRVFLINPNGILFGQGARIDVNGLFASTLAISNQDFLAGKFNFTDGTGTGSIQNQGTITTPAGGKVYLIAPDIENSGIINSPQGEILLAAGHSVQLVDSLNPDIAVVISAPENKVVNLGQIVAQSGKVGIYGGLISQKGVVNADSAVVGENGKIIFKATKDITLDAVSTTTANGPQGGRIAIQSDSGTTLVSGAIEAKGSNGGGGRIDLTGAAVSLGGAVSADGATQGGKIAVAANAVSLANRLSATGGSGQGGNIDIQSDTLALHNIYSTVDASGATGGTIREVAGHQITSSATYLATGTAGDGGHIDLSAPATKLLSVQIDASGATGGGQIRVGGEYQGGKNLTRDELPNAETLAISNGSNIKADASALGGAGGQIVLWSDREAAIYGAVSATPGVGGPGGLIEISSADKLTYGGTASAGSGGTVLFDPKNIVIDSAGASQYGIAIGAGYTGTGDLNTATFPTAVRNNDWFGTSVSLSGTQLAVGASNHDGYFGAATNTGAVYLISNPYTAPALSGVIGNGYTGTGNLNTAAPFGGVGVRNSDQFGNSVSLSGTQLAVGAPGHDGLGGAAGQTGAVYLINNPFSATPALFRVIGSGYTGLDMDTTGFPVRNNDYFGDSIALSGTQLVVSAPGHGGFDGTRTSTGAVYLISNPFNVGAPPTLSGIIGYGYTGAGNLNTATFPTPVRNGDTFGQSIAFSGTQLAVGAALHDGRNGTATDTGAVYLINNPFSTPALSGVIGNGYTGAGNLNTAAFPTPVRASDYFGISVALSGEQLAVGAYNHDGQDGTATDTGAVYLINNPFGTPALSGVIGNGYTGPGNLNTAAFPTPVRASDGFGTSLSLSGRQLLVGAYGHDGQSGTATDSGAVYAMTAGIGDPVTSATFANNPSANSTILPAAITTITNTGSNVVLQANNDITLAASSDILSNNPSGNGGSITMQAGRSILLNSNITTANGNLALIANDTLANGVVDANRDPGAAVITMASGTTLNAGTGSINIEMRNGAGKTYATTGDITLANITGAGAGSQLTTPGNLNVNGTISAGTVAVSANKFTLSGGTWNQVSATLPAFAVNDFSITSGTFIRALDGSGEGGAPYQLTDIYGLQGMGGVGMLGNAYVLANNINAAGTSGWNSGAGFVPVMDYLSGDLGPIPVPFTGTFDGLGRTISGLYINRPTTSYVGLFGYNNTTTGYIRNVGLVNANITGQSYVGGLVGFNYRGAISNSYSGGTVSGTTEVGGLVGLNYYYYGTISNSYSAATVTGGSSVGGLVGDNSGDIANSYSTGGTGGVTGTGDMVGGLVGYNHVIEGPAAISNSYSTSAVGGSSYVGGLVGYNYEGIIGNSYSTGAVTGAGDYIGGLVGYNDSTTFSIGTISNSYSTGIVNGTMSVGGLVGYNYGNISNSFSTGSVSGNGDVGGLVGYHMYGGAITDSYSTGAVTGTGQVIGGLVGYHYGNLSNSYSTGYVTAPPTSSFVGGLVGQDISNTGAITNSFWNTETSGQSVSGAATWNGAGATGLTTAGMTTYSSFSSIWSIANGGGSSATWRIYEGHTTPLLKSFLSPLTITADDVTKMYDGTSVGLTNAAYSDPAAPASGNLFGVATPYGSVAKNNVGTYAPNLWSNQQGYDITIGAANSAYGTLTVTPAPLTISTGNVTKTYDGTLTASGTASVTGGTLFSGDTLSGGTFAFTDKNVGIGNKTVTTNSITINDGNNGGNYSVSYANNTTSTINPFPVSLTGSRTYDGTANVAAGIFTFGPLVGNETLTLIGAGTLADKNVGTAKAVSMGTLALGNGTGLSSNYTFTGGTQTANITAAPLILSTANVTKTYDGTLTASGTASVTGGTLFSGDTLSSGTFAFTDKNVGIGNKTVTTNSITINDGNNGGNYSVSYANNTTSTINPFPVSLTGSRTYDGTANVDANAGILTLGPLVTTPAFYETLRLNGIGTMADKNVGIGKTVNTSGLTLADGYSGGIGPPPIFIGGLASNYTFTGGTQTVDITKAVIANVTGITANNKTYDGTTSATLVTTGAGFTSMIAGDSLSVGAATGAFSDKNAAIGKTVNISGIALGGTDAGNYTLTTSTASTTADIAKAAIANVTGITANNKTYDGTTSATLVTTGAGFTSMIAGDSLSVGAATGAFSDKNAAIGKTVNISGIALGGTDASNYTLTSNTAATTADITARALIITAATNTKPYDRTTSAAALPTITSGSIAGGDTATLSEVYDSKIAGTGKTLTPSAVISDGNSGKNYQVTYVNNTTGVIEPGQTVSGKLDVAGSGKTISFAVNGTLLADQATTDTGGNYSSMFPLNTIPGNNALLAYVANDTSVKGASVYLAPGGNIANLLLSSNTLTAGSGGGTISNSTLGTAKGALSSSDIPYSVSGTNLTVSPNFNFKTASGTTYSINGNITTTNGAQIYNGPVNLLANAALNAGTGNISFGGPITGTGYNFTLNSQGIVTQTAPILVSGLELLGTGGTYNLTDAGNAITTLAGHTGAVNFANSAPFAVGTVNTVGLATSGDITLNGVGHVITTDTSPVTSSGGTVSITAHSPLTIGSGGVSASENITLVASPSSGFDDLTINGPIASVNGSIILSAGSSLILGPGGSLNAPNGAITLNGAPIGTAANQAATDNTVSSLITAMGKIESTLKGDDENELTKKTSEEREQTTDGKKTEESVTQYCN